MVNYSTIAYQGTDPLFQHFKNLLDAEFAQRCKVNTDPTNWQMVGQALEDWYEVLDAMYSRISYYLNEAENKQVNEFFNKIEEITGGNSFATYRGSTEQNSDLRRTIRELARFIFSMMAKYQLFLSTKKQIDPKEAVMYD